MRQRQAGEVGFTGLQDVVTREQPLQKGMAILLTTLLQDIEGLVWARDSHLRDI